MTKFCVVLLITLSCHLVSIQAKALQGNPTQLVESAVQYIRDGLLKSLELNLVTDEPDITTIAPITTTSPNDLEVLPDLTLLPNIVRKIKKYLEEIISILEADTLTTESVLLPRGLWGPEDKESNVGIVILQIVEASTKLILEKSNVVSNVAKQFFDRLQDFLRGL